MQLAGGEVRLHLPWQGGPGSHRSSAHIPVTHPPVPLTKRTGPRGSQEGRNPASPPSGHSFNPFIPLAHSRGFGTWMEEATRSGHTRCSAGTGRWAPEAQHGTHRHPAPLRPASTHPAPRRRLITRGLRVANYGRSLITGSSPAPTASCLAGSGRAGGGAGRGAARRGGHLGPPGAAIWGRWGRRLTPRLGSHPRPIQAGAARRLLR